MGGEGGRGTPARSGWRGGREGYRMVCPTHQRGQDRGNPSQVRMGYPPPGQDMDGVPPWIGQVRMGYPPPQDVVPLSQDSIWTVYAAVGTPLAVSRRRIFLLLLWCKHTGWNRISATNGNGVFSVVARVQCERFSMYHTSHLVWAQCAYTIMIIQNVAEVFLNLKSLKL